MLPIAIAIGGAIAWITESRKRKAEIKGVEVINKQGEATAMQGMQSVYDKFVEDVRNQIAELRAENEDLRSEVAELKRAKTALQAEIAEVKKQAEIERKELTNKVHDLEAQNTELKLELDKYQKELKLYRKETKK